MARLTTKISPSDQQLLKKLSDQLDDLSERCIKLDASTKQSENHCFVFAVHLFPKRYLTLGGYIDHIKNTLNSLRETILKKRPELLIKHECELFVNQFQVLLKLVQGLEKGNAKLLYKSYSSLKEEIYQHLQKQYQYEHRLLNMISEQEELLQSNTAENSAYIKEKIAALKVRYQKCNTFTQKLEFQLEEIQDE